MRSMIRKVASAATPRNGTSRKKLKGDFGEAEIAVPRDRNGTFTPQIVPPHQRRFTGFDDKILSMYARGMTTREIQGHLEEIYGVEVSPSLISSVTDAVIEEVKEWQSRPLEPLYPILFLDALMVKMRHEGRVENRAVYVAVGIDLEGHKDVLGLWTSANEGAKFWLQVLTEIRNRGVQDIFIACVDGLKGFSAGYRDHLSPSPGADLHRAPGAGQPELRGLEGAQAGGRRSEDGLPGGDPPRRPNSDWKSSRPRWDGPLCTHCGAVAAAVAAGDSVLCLPGRNPQGDLHHQHGGIAEHESAQSAQDRGWPFPARTRP